MDFKNLYYQLIKLDLLYIFVLIIFLVVDLEVPQFVRVFSRGDDAEPISEVVLFQVFFGKIFQVPERKIKIPN